MKRSRERGDPAWCIVKEDSQHDFTWVFVAKLPYPFQKRETIGRYVSFTDTNESLVIAFAPVELEFDYGAKLNVVRRRTTSIIRFSPCEGDTAQCKLTLHQYGDMGGHVPAGLFARLMGRALAPVVDLRDALQRDFEIDASEWSKQATVIR